MDGPLVNIQKMFKLYTVTQSGLLGMLYGGSEMSTEREITLLLLLAPLDIEI